MAKSKPHIISGEEIAIFLQSRRSEELASATVVDHGADWDRTLGKPYTSTRKFLLMTSLPLEVPVFSVQTRTSHADGKLSTQTLVETTDLEKAAGVYNELR